MQAIERYRVNEILLVPTMIQMLVDHPAIGAHDLSSLRRIVFGASPMSEALLDRGDGRAAAYAVRAGLRHDRAVAGRDHPARIATRSAKAASWAAIAPAGAPRSACRSASWMRTTTPVPRGTVGEICVSGDVVMMGYWERPEETAKAVVDGWMHTGDGGYMDDDGFVYIVDRIKDMIVSGGENVYSAEVENVRGAVSRGRAVRRDRHSERAMGRGGACGRRAAARCDGGRRGADRVLPRADRRLQMPAQRRRCATRRCRCRAPARS